MHPTIVMLMILDYSKSQRDSFHRHKDLTQMLRQNMTMHNPIRIEFLHIV